MVDSVLNRIERLLLLAETEDARHKARLLFSHFMPDGRGDAQAEKMLFEAAERVADGYPVQYALGEWDFLDFTLKVGEGVLIPREETSALLAAARPFMREHPQAAVTELCAGSGALAIAAAREFPQARVAAVEKYESALKYLRENTALCAPEVAVVCADVMGYEGSLEPRSVDVIMCNPPYVTAAEFAELSRTVLYEPKQALTDGSDGLSFYRYIAENYFVCLSDGGLLVFEAGDGRADEIAEIMRGSGYTDIRVKNDCFECPRAVAGVKPLR